MLSIILLARISTLNEGANSYGQVCAREFGRVGSKVLDIAIFALLVGVIAGSFIVINDAASSSYDQLRTGHNNNASTNASRGHDASAHSVNAETFGSGTAIVIGVVLIFPLSLPKQISYLK